MAKQTKAKADAKEPTPQTPGTCYAVKDFRSIHDYGEQYLAGDDLSDLDEERQLELIEAGVAERAPTPLDTDPPTA